MSTYVELIAENIINTSFQNFAQKNLENAKYRILDVLGCAIGGVNAAGNAELINLIKAWGGREDATIYVYGGKAPAHNVAMVNSVLARSYDFEATQARVKNVNIASHVSGTTVPAALALGEATNAGGKELITALLIGDDVACRVLAASGFGFTLGWDNVGTVNALGATAIAGRFLGLNKKQLQNAFGIVLNQLSGSFEAIWDGAGSFKLLQGLSARNGIFSAELARLGWTGPKDALLGKFGYFNLYTEGCQNPEILIEDLGKNYYTEVTYKPYPCCRANHAAIDCALNLVGDYDITPDDIEQIVLKVPRPVFQMFVAQPFSVGDIPQIGAGFNLRYCVANVLLRKNITLEHFQEEYVRDGRIAKICAKIALEELNEDELKNNTACLKVIMNDGKEYISGVKGAKGDPVLSPLSEDEIKTKFMENISFSRKISEANAEKIINIIENLEKVDDLTDLIGLLTV